MNIGIGGHQDLGGQRPWPFSPLLSIRCFLRAGQVVYIQPWQRGPWLPISPEHHSPQSSSHVSIPASSRMPSLKARRKSISITWRALRSSGMLNQGRSYHEQSIPRWE